MSDEELFAEAYHQLVHSPLLDKVLKGTEAMSAQVNQMVTLRDAEINQLISRSMEIIFCAVDI